jgi:hypothetical protein
MTQRYRSVHSAKAQALEMVIKSTPRDERTICRISNDMLHSALQPTCNRDGAPDVLGLLKDGHLCNWPGVDSKRKAMHRWLCV